LRPDSACRTSLLCRVPAQLCPTCRALRSRAHTQIVHRSDSPIEIQGLEESKIGPRFNQPLPSTAPAPNMLPSQNRTRVNVQRVSESSGKLSSPLSLLLHLHSIKLPTSLPVDGLCSEALNSCFSIPSFVQERLSKGVVPVIQGGSTVLAQWFAMRVWLPLCGLPFFSPTPHKVNLHGAFLWWGPQLLLLINNDPCVQSQCQRDPRSAHQPICEQPRGSCEVCHELCG
jgi:hypothetical protein